MLSFKNLIVIAATCIAMASAAYAKPYAVDTAHGEKVVLDIQHGGIWCITSTRFERTCAPEAKWTAAGWNTDAMSYSMSFEMERKGDLTPADNPYRTW